MADDPSVEATNPTRRFGPSGAALAIGGVVLGALGLWGLQKVWVLAGELDRDPDRNGLQERLMQRKAAAMHDLLDAAVAGRLERVESAAARVESSAEGIDSFLSTPMYQDHGEAFFRAVKDVQEAARRDDYAATNEAALRLERACLECHQVLLHPAGAG